MPKDLGERQFHFLASFVNFQFIDLNSLFLWNVEDKELSILIESLRISETNNDNSSSVSSQSNLSSKK
jgi:hypothetical protein